MLFCDTYHDAQTVGLQLRANKDRVRKYIVIHTAETFGEKDQDGAPGVLPGVRAFVREHPDWTVLRQDRNNHGLIVLSRRDEDRKTPPGLLRKALNFTKALAIHTATGAELVDDETHERRVELCLLCPERAHDVCSLCGCSIAAKASWAEQQCPANPPQWLSASVSSPRVPSSV